MTSFTGDEPPDPVGQPSENKQSATEEPLDSGSLTIWPKAEFLHWAQVLARRLANWHIDDVGPVWAPEGIGFLQEIERPFRYRVMLGEHDSKKTFAPPIRLISTAPNANSDNDLAGYAVTLFPDGYRKDETVWLFRDYYEHLVQLGDSDAEELLRLKIEQLLDSRMYRRARSEVQGDYIAGHPVDHSLLDELIEAAKHCFDNTSPGRKCGICGKPMRNRDQDRVECNDCRSPKGKLEDLYIAIHASGDSPDRIPEWPTIRAILRDAFGIDRTNEQLWELMTDRLRFVGWDDERWLRTKYDQFIELLKAGLMKDRSVIAGIEQGTLQGDIRPPNPVLTVLAKTDPPAIDGSEQQTPAEESRQPDPVATAPASTERSVIAEIERKTLAEEVLRLLADMAEQKPQDQQSGEGCNSGMPSKVEPGTQHPANSSEADDKLPKSKRKDSASRVKAKSAYDYAMAQIQNANVMTAAELFDAIKLDGEAAAMLPPSAASFTKYLNDCGIRLKKGHPKDLDGSSIVRQSDL